MSFQNFTSEQQRELSLRNIKKHYANKTGIWSENSHKKAYLTKKKLGKTFDNKELAAKAGRLAAISNRKSKKSLFDSNIRKLGPKTQKKLKIGFWNSNTQRRLGHKGGLQAVLINRQNKPYWHKNVPFDSKDEIVVCKVLQIRPQERKNVHVIIGHKEFDFVTNNTIIDYHPWDRRLTHSQYLKQRRKVLNENGFKDYKYLVIKNLETYKREAKV